MASCLGLVSAPAAGAEPARSALVIAIDSYVALPALSSCAGSSNAVATALRGLGYELTLRENASTGGADAGIGDFTRRLSERKGSAVIYVCGYGAVFNDRVFLLPATARIARPADVLTQGILLKSILATVDSDRTTTAVVALDIVPQPGGPDVINLASLSAADGAEGVGIIAVSQTASSETVSPLGRALVASLAGPVVRTERLLDDVRTQLAGSAASIVALHMPTRPENYLAGAPPPRVGPPQPPVQAASPPPDKTSAQPANAPPAIADQAVAAQPPVAEPARRAEALPVRELPDEELMTDDDRRLVQQALIRLGYYSRSTDGIFGADTRAAIRRYQHEIGAEMTGYIAGEQATRLVGTP